MSSTSGNGSTNFVFDKVNVMPHTVDNAGGYQAADYQGNLVSGGHSLAFSELKGGKRKSKKGSKKTSRKSSKKIFKKRKTARRGKKTMKNTIKGFLGLFKK